MASRRCPTMPILTTLVSSLNSAALHPGSQVSTPPPLKAQEFLKFLFLFAWRGVVSSYLPRNFDTYGQVSCGLLDKGYEQDMHQCHVKIKELRQAYQKAREANRCFGAMPKTCCFYKELDAILDGDPTSTAKSLVDISAGLEAADSGLNPEDKVMDDEVELEDNVEPMAGSSGCATSWDLFSTPEGSNQSQQPVFGAHDAGEESPDVAFRGMPYTLAEHLPQIRK
ncbi:uncharacterized protein [Lepidochelys kempii]|uniref:uncharacterized protein n=1 Tax=Lepidochelys kempii TaxID=8472 RepID=UPI003C6EB305